MRGIDPTKNSHKGLALLVTSFVTLVSIVLIECVLRYFFIIPSPLGIAQPLGYGVANSEFNIKQKDFNVLYRYNRNGFRDGEIPVNLVSHDMQRILFLGDSMVEGFGVEENERFSNVLIDRLNSQIHNEPILGINVAQMATNPDSYLDNFYRFGVALKPDTVVMGIFLGNDFDNGTLAKVVDIPAAKGIIEIYKYTDCGTHSSERFRGFYFYALAQQSFCEKKILSPRFHGGNIWEQMFRLPINEETLAVMSGVDAKDISKKLRELPDSAVSDTLKGLVNPAFLVQSLKARAQKVTPKRLYTREYVSSAFSYINAINEIAKTNQIKLIVVVIPTVYEIYPDRMKELSLDYWGLSDLPPVVHEFKELHEWLRDFLEARKIVHYDPTIDLIHEDHVTYHLYDQHLNSVGHRVIADGLTKLLSVH